MDKTIEERARDCSLGIGAKYSKMTLDDRIAAALREMREEAARVAEGENIVEIDESGRVTPITIADKIRRLGE